MAPLTVQRLLPEAIPDAWVSGKANVTAISTALASQEGNPIPWTVLQRAIDSAIAARWLEIAPGSGTWPCDVAAAKEVKLRTPIVSAPPPDPVPTIAFQASARLEPSELQDLVDALDQIVQASAGVRLEFRLALQLGDNARDVPSETVDRINALLVDINSDLRLQ